MIVHKSSCHETARSLFVRGAQAEGQPWRKVGEICESCGAFEAEGQPWRKVTVTIKRNFSDVRGDFPGRYPVMVEHGLFRYKVGEICERCGTFEILTKIRSDAPDYKTRTHYQVGACGVCLLGGGELPPQEAETQGFL